MTVFEIPGENPDSPETVKEFSAVILHHHPLYAYYTDNTPADLIPLIAAALTASPA